MFKKRSARVFSIIAAAVMLIGILVATPLNAIALQHLTPEEVAAYSALSPFELKNDLIDAADNACKEAGSGCEVLNAGRGNPNFVNTTVRKAFCHLGMFAANLADGYLKDPDLGLRPEVEGIAKKLDDYLDTYTQGRGAIFLKQATNYAEDNFGMDRDEAAFELIDAALGSFYPSPPRIIPVVEEIVNRYLYQVLFADDTPPPGKFDLFATEGATAAMIYTFKSLKENHILKEGDSIAIITPIFSPYLEIPSSNDYRLVQIHVQGNEDMGWQIPDSEIEKLADPKIKALYLVNPTNPTSVSLNKESLGKIVKLIKEKQQNLIVLTDTVYATFVDEFHTLLSEVPENTICVYSYSKYFGVTGWRLGVIMLHENNIIDRMIAALPPEEKAELNERYGIDSTTPEKIPFIERIVMDSRDVALAHTGGLSGPQQCIMALFSLFNIMDKDMKYKQSIHAILDTRIKNLYDRLGIAMPEGPEKTHYYALIDLERMAQAKYGGDFSKYLTGNYSAIDFLFNLAREKYSICLPGAGFAGPEWSIRVSLANLADKDYIAIGNSITEIMEEYYHEWQAKSKQ
jgi:aspartate 4-decarboxylase